MKPLKKSAIMALFLFIAPICFSKNIYCQIPTSSLSETIENKHNANKLYEEIKKFLSSIQDIPPENFDDICHEYLLKSIPQKNLLSEYDFIKKSNHGLVLYRGLSSKEFADDLKNGKIYTGSGVKNVFGTGVYTSSSIETAKAYSDKKDPSTIVKLLIPISEIRVLENTYLEKLKKIICIVHKDEFQKFFKKSRLRFVTDNVSIYLNKKFKGVYERISKENITDSSQQIKLFEIAREEAEKAEEFQKMKYNIKKCFRTNEAAVFYNSGLLTKLLGYDCLHVKTYMTDKYLIVNTDNLYVLSK